MLQLVASYHRCCDEPWCILKSIFRFHLLEFTVSVVVVVYSEDESLYLTYANILLPGGGLLSKQHIRASCIDILLDSIFLVQYMQVISAYETHNESARPSFQNPLYPCMSCIKHIHLPFLTLFLKGR